MSEQRTIVAALKWFDVHKGYGFVQAVDHPVPIGDIFLHAEVARKMWPNWQPPDRGTKMKVLIQKRYRGWAVKTLIDPVLEAAKES